MKTNRTSLFPESRFLTLIALVASAITLITTTPLAIDAPSQLKLTAETASSSPVDVVGREEIEKVGAQDVLQTLRTFSPSFFGNGNIGETLNNGGYGEAYVAIRNLPTLVLVDGQRLPISPFSTSVQTFSPDVNMIPISFIDRIEVLKDGASTIYGSDAIGGVVNIITKKRPDAGREGLFSPVWGDFDAHYGFGLNHGTYNESSLSGNIGYDKGGTRALLGGAYYQNDPILAKDRHIASLSAEELQAAGMKAPSYFSPTYSGRVGDFLLAGSPLAEGAPGYRPGLNTPPTVSGGPFPSVEAYNSAAFTQLGYEPYIPITSIPAGSVLGTKILNTSLLNPISLQEQNRLSAFGNVEQDIFEDHLVLHGQMIYTETDSKGQLAPQPIPSLTGLGLTVPANNPYNPFGTDLGFGGTDSRQVRSRLIETGPRVFETLSSLWHYLIGARGNILDNKVRYDITASCDQTTSTLLRNRISLNLLDWALQPSAGNPNISVLDVPIYNIFALPGVNDPATIKAIEGNSAQTGFSELFEARGVLTWDMFELPGGTFALAPGAAYIHEKLVLNSDSFDTFQPLFTADTRDREAGFVEARIPVTAPDMRVPGFYSLEIDAAGRIEYIDSRGITTYPSFEFPYRAMFQNHSDTAVPKVGARWQPIDEQLTIRGTYSQSYLMPQLTQLFGRPLGSSPNVVTPASPNDPALILAEERVNYLSNPDLPPSTAETFTGGGVYSPKWAKNLTVTVDWYHVDQKNYNFYPSASQVVADLNANGAASIWNNNSALHGDPIYVNPYGLSHLPVPGDPSTYITAENFGALNLPMLPGGSIRTEGLDMGLNYRWDLQAWGVLNLFGNANYLFDYQVKLGAGTPWLNYKGEYTDSQLVVAAQGLIPDYNVAAGFTYSLGNFDYTVILHYLPSAIDLGDMHPSVGSPVNHFTQSGKPWQVADYYRLDMQLAYNFISKNHNNWWDNTRIAIGCNNITDQNPSLIASSSEDNTDKTSYDIVGRFLYFELNKRF